MNKKNKHIKKKRHIDKEYFSYGYLQGKKDAYEFMLEKLLNLFIEGYE